LNHRTHADASDPVARAASPQPDGPTDRVAPTRSCALLRAPARSGARG